MQEMNINCHEIGKLRRRNNVFNQAHDNFVHENETLKAEIVTLKADIVTLKAENETLKAEIRF